MKKLFFLLFMFYCFSLHSQPGWFIQPVGINSFMSEVTMSDINTVFIAADTGRILKTTNGGINWLSTILPTTGELFAIDFPSNSVGYTAGAQGKVFKTTNSGANWFSLSSPTTSGILSVKFINENTGFIGGGAESDGEIFKTTNGGANWTEYGPGTTYPQIVSTNFPNDNTGYAAGRNGLIMKSSNGGINWTIQQAGLGSVSFFSVFFTSENTGYLTTPFPGNILKTTNGGTNWNSIYNNPDHFVVTMFFTSTDTGFVIGANTNHQTIVLKTTNGGSSWTAQFLDFDGHVNSINFINPSTGFIAGDEGRLYKTTNGGATVGIETNYRNIPDNFFLYQNFPNPFNPSTTINYELRIAGFVTLKMYDILGNELLTLVDQKKSSGNHKIELNASDLPGGIYFYTMEWETSKQTRKMLLLK